MKKILHVKITVFILMTLITTSVCSACGKADKDDIARDLSENVAYTATESDGEAVPDEDIPEKLTYTINGSQSTIKVNADVYADGYGNVPTYNIIKCEKDDAWLDGYAKKFFDDGEYENIKPYRFCSMDELTQEKSFCEELLSEYEVTDGGYGMIMAEKRDIESYIENYDETEYVKYPDDKLIYEFDADFTLQDGRVPGCESAHLKGKANEKLWYMNYERGISNHTDPLSEEEKEYYGVYGEQMGLLYGICPENTPNIMYTMDIDIGFPNKCEREASEKEAEKLLEAFGLENMKEIYISALRVDTDENEDKDESHMLDGYIITYAPRANEIDFLYGTMAEYVGPDYVGVASSEAEIPLNSIAGQPFVKIGISSEGIFEFCIYEQYEIGDALTERSSMLSFEQVDNKAKSFFEQMAESGKTDIEVDEVQFGYVCVTYDGISYAMVPVWRYYYVVSGGSGRYPFLTVCALDGSYLLPYGNLIYNDFLWLD